MVYHLYHAPSFHIFLHTLCYHQKLTEIDMGQNCSMGRFGASREVVVVVHARSWWAPVYLYLIRDKLVFVLFKLEFDSLSVKTTSYKYVTIPDE